MRAILDVIYWRLHSAFLRNKRSEAIKFMSMLEDEIAHSKSSLVSEIGPIQMGRYRKIKDRMSRGEFGRLYGDGSSIEDLLLSSVSDDSSGPEKDFCRLLMRDSSKLLGAMDFEFWSSLVAEVKMPLYGRCDFVVFEGRRAAVVEVKMGKAPTSIVSQIDKYRLAMDLDMCLGTHDEVLAYVLAESFPPYVATELSRLDVKMIEHKGTPSSLRKVEKNASPW